LITFRSASTEFDLFAGPITEPAVVIKTGTATVDSPQSQRRLRTAGSFLTAFLAFLIAGDLYFLADFFTADFFACGLAGDTPTEAAIFPAAVPMVIAALARIPLGASGSAFFFAIWWQAYHDVEGQGRDTIKSVFSIQR
jgi:hypothetical protein